MGNTCRVGNIRPSQLLWTYGPGAMIDLPNFSVMTMGLDSWKQDQCHLIEEPRLLEQVRKMCGAQVERMLQPPVCETELDNPNDPHSYIGVPVQPFPRWFRCVKCGMMAEYDSGLFDIKDNFYRSERTRFVHANCPKGHGKPVDAVPVRFLVACKHGHVDDFPWRWFVHDGPSECQGALYFYEKGASLQTENLWVECKGCGKRKSLAKAFGQIGQETLPACRGHHPHLGYDADSFSDCKEKLRPILLGATNSWFPVTVSVLAIPTRDNELAQLVADNWTALNVITSVEMLTMAFTLWQAQGLFVELRSYGVNDVWAAIEKERKPKKAEAVTDEDIKVPEWNELISEKPIGKFPFFVCKKGVVPDAFKNEIRKVVLLERLRKVNALVGFTRIEARPVSARARLSLFLRARSLAKGSFCSSTRVSLQNGRLCLPSRNRRRSCERRMRGGARTEALIRQRDFPGRVSTCFIRLRICSFVNSHSSVVTTRQAFRKESMRKRVRSRWRAFWSIRRHLILTAPWEVWLDWARLKSLA